MTAIKEIPEVAALDAKINTVVYGELYNQHYKEIQHKFWDAIDAIQKRLSAATPPDVEQMAKMFSTQLDEFTKGRSGGEFIKIGAEWAKKLFEMEIGQWKDIANSNANANEEACKMVYELRKENEGLRESYRAVSKMYSELYHKREDKKSKAGQSAVQDATPQEKIDSLNHLIKYQQGKINKYKSKLSTLRSELSAAQEENKRLREALGVVMPYLDDFEKDNIQDSSVGLFKDYRFTKAYHELQSFFPPE